VRPLRGWGRDRALGSLPDRSQGTPVSRPLASRRLLTAAVLAVSLLVLSACRIDVAAELDLRDDGSGSAALELFLDRELLGLLDELAVDAVDEVTAATEETEGWDLEVLAEGADGLRLRLEHAGPDPAGALEELTAGLVETDPALLVDVEVEPVQHEDAADELHVAGSALLRPPVAAGVLDAEGAPVGPDAEELAALVRDHVSAELAVTLPGEVRHTDATRVDEDVLVWELPPGERVEVAATAELDALPLSQEVLIAVAAGLVAVAVGVAIWLWRRRD
jgi:hypothetical protein